MKKFLAVMLTLSLLLTGVVALADEAVKSEGVMTYADYVAAELDSEVVIETYV